MRIARALLLVGSAKAAGASTSESLARYLAQRFEAAGVATHLVHVSRAVTADDGEQLAADLADADLFVLASPLYVDSLPYLVTRAFESLALRRRTAPSRPCAFVPLINCGFPEARHCQTALDICRVFAREAHFDWAGGLALGEGGMIDGRPLEQVGGVARGVRTALDSAAAALAEGAPVPADAVKRLARGFIPSRVYTALGNIGWRRQARRNGVRRQLKARPFGQ